ncbi:aromatic ring-hydroxylating dioxygenase subunit alpha [Pigmentiphaga soli]
MQGVVNAWYPLAWTSELGQAPVRRTVLGRPIVAWRGADGAVAALDDLCPHRLAPLSRGRLRDGAIECAYHGLRFAADGRCVRVPGEERIAPALKVARYATREKLGLAWIWMGDPEQARPQDMLDIPEADRPGWAYEQGDALGYGCHYLNLCDNLCDPSHVSFLHPTTLGDPLGEGVPIDTRAQGRSIVVSRWIRNVPPVASFAPFIAGPVDRWQYYTYHAPSITVVDFGTAPAGRVGPEGDRNLGLRVLIGHCITPVDDERCIDHWFSLRNFGTDDPAVGRALHDGFRVAYQEDKDMLEAIQQEERRHPGVRPVRIGIDAAPVRMRRLVGQMQDAAGPAASRG